MNLDERYFGNRTIELLQVYLPSFEHNGSLNASILNLAFNNQIFSAESTPNCYGIYKRKKNAKIKHQPSNWILFYTDCGGGHFPNGWS